MNLNHNSIRRNYDLKIVLKSDILEDYHMCLDLARVSSRKVSGK